METPLGLVSIDTTAHSQKSEAAHRREHSLEVQLPFLQQVLGELTLVPLAVGSASREEVTAVLEREWDRSRILISTDLSHYLSWEDATKIDARTAKAIVALDAAAIGDDQACGSAGLRAFLELARQKRMTARQLDVRNSGDTAGDRSRVVGYGAFAFYEAQP
jgi:AmmeMemoRadiSam system protein B